MTDDAQPGGVPHLRIACGGRDYTVSPHDGPITIGRQFPAQIMVEDPRISGTHVRLEADGTRWRARDLSTNGVYVQGQRQHEFVIADHSTITLGHPEGIPVSFAFVDAGERERTAGHMQDGARTGDADADEEDPHGEDLADVTLAVGDNDVGVARAGAAVSARRRQLDIAQRGLAAGGIVNAGALIAFEKGRSWPRRATRTKIEEVLQWPEGTIERIRSGVATDVPGVPAELLGSAATLGRVMVEQGTDTTEALTTNVVAAPLMAQAVAVALSSIATRTDRLDEVPAEKRHAVITEMLGELRNLEHIASTAASMATRAPTVLKVLSEVRRTYRTLMLQAADHPQATPGQKLFAARTRAHLTVDEAANAAGVTPADIEEIEAGQPVSKETERAAAALRLWLSGP